jgi:hypothetical protein
MATKRVHIPTARKQGEMIQDERGRFVGFKDPNVVYVSRRHTQGGYDLPESRFQNWFTVKEYGLEEAVRRYREELLSNPELLARAAEELEGKTLACWCEVGQLCHGDVLIELVGR